MKAYVSMLRAPMKQIVSDLFHSQHFTVDHLHDIPYLDIHQR